MVTVKMALTLLKLPQIITNGSGIQIVERVFRNIMNLHIYLQIDLKGSGFFKIYILFFVFIEYIIY